MSAIEEVITAIQAVIDELDNASAAASTATDAADQGLNQAMAAGVGAGVAGYNTIKETLEKLTQQVAAAADTANEAIGHARAVADGT